MSKIKFIKKVNVVEPENKWNIQFSKMTYKELEEVRALIDKEYKIRYDDLDNFMYHTDGDKYYYIIKYYDGTTTLDYIGQRAYQKYINDVYAIAIYRERKSNYDGKSEEERLCRELLMEKECPYTPTSARYGISTNQLNMSLFGS